MKVTLSCGDTLAIASARVWKSSLESIVHMEAACSSARIWLWASSMASFAVTPMAARAMSSVSSMPRQ